MPALSNLELLQVWEYSAAMSKGARPGTRSALLWLAAGWPYSSWTDLAAMPLGARDCRLLELYRDTFGDSLECRTDCGDCGEELELNLSATELLAGLASARGGKDIGQGDQHELEHQGVRMVFRLPTSADLLAAEGCSEPDEARRLLSERCVLEAYRQGEAVSLAQLEDSDIETLADSIARTDPAGEIRIAVRCPECDHAWKERFDIVAFLDRRGRERALRLLGEVHLLARAYGWSEDGILALSDQRRRAYLEMLGHV